MWNRTRLFGFIFFLIYVVSACQSTKAPPPVEQEPAPEIQTQAPVEQKQSRADSLYELALWTAQAEQVEKAIEQFQLLINEFPEYPRAYTNLGLLLLQQDKLEPAKNALLRAIEQDNNDAIAYNHLAIIERKQGAFKKSRTYYESALDADPEYANAHLNLGILLDIYLQDLKTALKHYKSYQKLTGNKDKTVDKWIIDIQRRIESAAKKS